MIESTNILIPIVLLGTSSKENHFAISNSFFFFKSFYLIRNSLPLVGRVREGGIKNNN
jgi:hypothetical protein